MLAFTLWLAVPFSCLAEYILQSATLGPIGVPGNLSGYVVSSVQFVGARFHVNDVLILITLVEYWETGQSTAIKFLALS